MHEFDTLQEVIDPKTVVGYNMLIKDGNLFGTSDVDLAAFLTQKGNRLIGAVPRTFKSGGRTKTKVIMVFNRDDILNECLDNWEGGEGMALRAHKTEYRRLMAVINDVVQ